jgi:S-adenosylmethionine hydrolase
MKGVILGRFPAARIVDLTHEILAHWPAEAGFWLQRSFEYFPPGTVHVAVVDPGVGTARDIIAVSARGHLLLAPDNGLLANVVDSHADAAIFRLQSARWSALNLAPPSATFHGRDIFAPLAAELAAGRSRPEDLGVASPTLVPSWLEAPQIDKGSINGVVVTFDHFGNLLTNIDAKMLEGFIEPHVYVGHQLLPLRRTYGDARPGEFLALINSFSVVEIACAEGDAAERLGVSRGAPVVVRDGVRQR